MIPWGTHLIPNTWQLIWTNWLLLVTDLPQQMLKEEQEEPLRWWPWCWSPLASESGQCRLPWCAGPPSFLLWEVAASVPFPHLHDHGLVRVAQLLHWGLWSQAGAFWGTGKPPQCSGHMPARCLLSLHPQVPGSFPRQPGRGRWPQLIPSRGCFFHPSRNWPLQDSRWANFLLMDFCVSS